MWVLEWKIISSVAYKIGEEKNDPLAMYASDIMTEFLCLQAAICYSFLFLLLLMVRKEEKLVALSQIGDPVPLAS
ncbi:glutamyl-tRNA(Gln) amidotransferase subunit A, chloroplastic/mitochondrial [Trifolium repens]|nr:glutamyl-tRNA(Gln) amidotransferase subunit A, chloroplastic/mitochondrial [Trifolium repens]